MCTPALYQECQEFKLLLLISCGSGPPGALYAIVQQHYRYKKTTYKSDFQNVWRTLRNRNLRPVWEMMFAINHSWLLQSKQGYGKPTYRDSSSFYTPMFGEMAFFFNVIKTAFAAKTKEPPNPQATEESLIIHRGSVPVFARRHFSSTHCHEGNPKS